MGELGTLVDTKRHTHDELMALAGVPALETASVLARMATSNCEWRVSCPLDALLGATDVLDAVWLPLKHAFPDLERRDNIFVGGMYQGRTYVAAIGHYCGTFRQDWLGIPATGKPAFLRYGEVYEIRNGKIVQANCLWDILDLIRQAGFWPIAKSTGTEGLWPGPFTGDGLVFHETDAVQSAANLAQTLAMHKTLGDYKDQDGKGRDGLLAMPQKQHWHPRMMWYGPSGIGMSRGLEGFVDHHQLPFRLAFPNRTGGGQWDRVAEEKKRLGGGHYIRIGDGCYSVTGGWPSVMAIHAGGNFLGQSATNKVITMRVMDFYLHHEGLIRENWVPIDILDVLRQMGVDVFARILDAPRRNSARS